MSGILVGSNHHRFLGKTRQSLVSAPSTVVKTKPLASHQGVLTGINLKQGQ